MRRAFVLTAFASMLGAACSLIVDTDGLAGDPLVPDSGFDGAPSRPIDPPVEAGLDASDASDACVTSATRFCDDFDELPLGGKWETRTETRGHVTFDGVGLSPPRAAQFTVTAGSGDGRIELGQQLSQTVPISTHCEFDVHLDDIPTKGELDVFDIGTQRPGFADHHAYIGSFDGQWAVAEYVAASDAGPVLDREQQIGFPLAMGVWHHVVVDYTLTALDVTFDGLPARLGQLTAPSTGARLLTIGMTYVDGSIQSAGLLFDNVDCASAF